MFAGLLNMSGRRGQYTLPQEGASLKAEVDKSMADSSTRSFRLDDVHSKQMIGYEMSSEFEVVSQLLWHTQVQGS